MNDPFSESHHSGGHQLFGCSRTAKTIGFFYCQNMDGTMKFWGLQHSYIWMLLHIWLSRGELIYKKHNRRPKTW